jgi:hypothetical protein
LAGGPSCGWTGCGNETKATAFETFLSQAEAMNVVRMLQAPLRSQTALEGREQRQMREEACGAMRRCGGIGTGCRLPSWT